MTGNRQYISFILLLFILQTIHGQNKPDLESTVTVKVENITILDFIEYLNRHYHIQTGYFNQISAFDEIISVDMRNQPLKTVLDTVFRPHNIQFIMISEKLILKETIPDENEPVIVGTIYDQVSKQPLPYCAVQIQSTYRGCISNGFGHFKLEPNREETSSSVIFSILGYKPDTIPINHILQWSDYKIYLKPTTYQINAAEIKDKPGTFTRLGNKGFLTSGSIYMDTHGQQTALFIDNVQDTSGRVVKVSYYLSKKGNINAPFRIRIYKKDTATNAPSEDLLKEIVVVKPESNDYGWFDINISRFNVTFPKEGFFVAIEGVYPDDFDNVYTGYDFISDELTGVRDYEIDDFDLVSFGQRLGYNRKGENCTWHYSITGEWFQVNKKNFNAMIATEIKFYKDESK